MSSGRLNRLGLAGSPGWGAPLLNSILKVTFNWLDCAVKATRKMIVCHCHAINDRTIRDTVRAGAHSPRAVARACGAGAGCGGCRHSVERIIESEQCTRSDSLFSAEGLPEIGLASTG